MEERQNFKTHRVTLNNRNHCTLTGVTDILSFDVTEILLETDMGMLMINGKDLHVNRLTVEKGEVDISGKINGFQYSELKKSSKAGESFWSRVFK